MPLEYRKIQNKIQGFPLNSIENNSIYECFGLSPTAVTAERSRFYTFSNRKPMDFLWNSFKNQQKIHPASSQNRQILGIGESYGGELAASWGRVNLGIGPPRDPHVDDMRLFGALPTT